MSEMLKIDAKEYESPHKDLKLIIPKAKITRFLVQKVHVVNIGGTNYYGVHIHVVNRAATIAKILVKDSNTDTIIADLKSYKASKYFLAIEKSASYEPPHDQSYKMLIAKEKITRVLIETDSKVRIDVEADDDPNYTPVQIHIDNRDEPIAKVVIDDTNLNTMEGSL